jgi:hypothetical protein
MRPRAFFFCHPASVPAALSPGRVPARRARRPRAPCKRGEFRGSHALPAGVARISVIDDTFARVASNRGRRTAGVDGVTVHRVLSKTGADAFLSDIRMELRTGSFHPSPTRRVLIPKSGQPGKFRPLETPAGSESTARAVSRTTSAS